MRWMVVVTQSKYVEELRKAPEDEVSASEAMKEVCSLYLHIVSHPHDQEASRDFLCHRLGAVR